MFIVCLFSRGLCEAYFEIAGEPPSKFIKPLYVHGIYRTLDFDVNTNSAAPACLFVVFGKEFWLREHSTMPVGTCGIFIKLEKHSVA